MPLTFGSYFGKRRARCEKRKVKKPRQNTPMSKGGDPTISGEITRSAPRQLDKLTKLSSKYTPPRACNTCSAASICPLVKPNHECAFQSVIEGFKIDSEDDLKTAVLALVEKNMERVQFASIMENLTGQTTSKELTDLVRATGFLIEQASKVHKSESAAPRDNNSIIQAIFGATQINIQRPNVPTGNDTYLLDDEARASRDVAVHELIDAREVDYASS